MFEHKGFKTEVKVNEDGVFFGECRKQDTYLIRFEAPNKSLLFEAFQSAVDYYLDKISELEKDTKLSVKCVISSVPEHGNVKVVLSKTITKQLTQINNEPVHINNP